MRKRFFVATIVLALAGVSLASASTSYPTGQVVRDAISKQSIYFVMTDRFANGDTSNDTGGIVGTGSLSGLSGFNPTDPGYFHGGDLKGLTSKLDYIHNLGFTSIWITPPVKGQTLNGGSANYHGYWGQDFTTIDPHLGTEADFKNFVDGAHARGMKVILDIVVNHTGDFIFYPGGNTAYLDLKTFPYKDCNGKPIDITKLADKSTFPKLCANISFPYKPLINSENKNIRKPAFLNDLTNYHNRGNTTFDGFSNLYGDFFGLDDLFTEKPAVLKGEIDLWASWISRFKIDGFRIDTAQYVNQEFWNQFIPSMLKTAKANGIPGFAIFGEISNSDAGFTSDFVINQSYPSVLDFPFQTAATRFVSVSNTANQLAQFFNSDDLYTTAHSSAYNLVTFMGNHDMGRIGNFILGANPTDPAQNVLERDQLAQTLLLLSRGAPTVYYGDEIGMTGDGGDKAARQDMLPTQVTSWQSEPRIGGQPIGTGSGFDVTNPLQKTITDVNTLLTTYPDLKNGIAQVRYGQGSIYAVSRFAGSHEYLEVFNDGDDPATANIPVSTTGTWQSIYGASDTATTANGAVSVTLPARSAMILRSDNSFVPATASPSIKLSDPALDGQAPGWQMLTASVPGTDFNQVSFDVTSDGKNWKLLGTTDHRTFAGDYIKGGLYRIYLHPKDYRAGAKLTIVAVLKSYDGKTVYSKPMVDQL